MTFEKHNLNNRVKVKLNEKGIEIIKADSPLHDLTEDENGYVTLQTWKFMRLFGNYMRIGGAMPFDSQILIEILEE